MIPNAEESWAVMRALYEEGVTFARLAALRGIEVETVEKRARRDGWMAGGDRSDDLLQRLRRVHERAVTELECAMREAGAPDRQRVEAAATLMKAGERLEEGIMRAERQAQGTRQRAETAKEEQESRDAEMADILRRIDRQIIALARNYARELAGGGLAAAAGGATGQAAQT